MLCGNLDAAGGPRGRVRRFRILPIHPPQSVCSPWSTSQPAVAPTRFLARRSGPVSACRTPAGAWRTDRRQDLLTGVDS